MPDLDVPTGHESAARRRRPASPPDELASRLLTGERRALARAITLVESTRPEHREQADRLFDCLAQAGRPDSLRLAVSGVPGVGKSTFIEALGCHAVSQGQTVAVLTIDPSSALSGGAILGDKTRMNRLASLPEAFIRPSPSAGSLGGVHRRTREVISLCEAAGFDLVIVETVGVGQSESAAADMTDMFALLLLPSGGDELQGIKRGIVELADVLLVNKADGELEPVAGRTVADYRNALRLLRPRDSEWVPEVRSCSSLTGAGIAQAWELIGQFAEKMRSNGHLAERRSRQAVAWLKTELGARLEEVMRSDQNLARQLELATERVRAGAQAPVAAAGQLVEAFLGARRS